MYNSLPIVNSSVESLFSRVEIFIYHTSMRSNKLLSKDH